MSNILLKRDTKVIVTTSLDIDATIDITNTTSINSKEVSINDFSVQFPNTSELLVNKKTFIDNTFKTYVSKGTPTTGNISLNTYLSSGSQINEESLLKHILDTTTVDNYFNTLLNRNVSSNSAYTLNTSINSISNFGIILINSTNVYLLHNCTISKIGIDINISGIPSIVAEISFSYYSITNTLPIYTIKDTYDYTASIVTIGYITKNAQVFSVPVLSCNINILQDIGYKVNNTIGSLSVPSDPFCNNKSIEFSFSIYLKLGYSSLLLEEELNNLETVINNYDFELVIPSKTNRFIRIKIDNCQLSLNHKIEDVFILEVLGSTILPDSSLLISFEI